MSAKWQWGDPITAEDLEAAAEKYERREQHVIAALMRSTAESQRLGDLRALLRNRRVCWTVGWH